MANLLDTLLADGVRQSAPNAKPFQMGEFLTNAGQLRNVSEGMNELDRQNSVRNLVAQREREGIPFEQLSDEVAKYDLDKAYKMRDEARTSGTWNRQESEAELANHKKYMAGWLGGVVLRRATEAVGNGTWDYETVVNICNKAAAVIFPYDPATATALINFGKQGLAKKAVDESRVKFTKDHERDGTYLRSMNGNIKTNADPNSDPNNYDRNTNRYLASRRLMEWKAANPYNERNLKGRQLWSYMINGLIAKGVKDKKGVGKYTDEEISAFFPDAAEVGASVQPSVNESEVEGQHDIPQVPQPSAAPSKSDSTSPNSSDASLVSDSGNAFVKDLTKPGRGGRIILDPEKTRILQSYINNCVSIEELNKIKEALSGSPDLERDNSSVFKRLWDEVNKKEKEINDVIGEADNATYEDLMKLKKLVGARNMNSVLVKSLRNFVNAMSGYTTTDTPYTSVTNWILVTQPDYKYINDDIEMAKTLRTNNKLTNVKSLLAKTAPFKSLREVMARDVAPEVMYAMAKDGTNAMRSWWKGVSKNKTPEQINAIKLMYSNMFGIDDDFWPYIEGKVHVPTPKEAEDLKKEYEDTESKLPSITQYKGKSGASAPSGKKPVSNEDLQKALNGMK